MGLRLAPGLKIFGSAHTSTVSERKIKLNAPTGTPVDSGDPSIS